MGQVLDKLLAAYKLQPVNVKKDQKIDIGRLPSAYKQAFCCIFYPKTLIDNKDIEYLEVFWSKRPVRLEQYVSLIQYYGDDEVDYKGGRVIWSVSIIVCHFKPIRRLEGICVADNRGSLMLKAIVIPESFVVDRLIDNYLDNPSKLIFSTIVNTSVKFSEDSGLYTVSDKAYLLIVDINELSALMSFRTGSAVGKCDCIEDMICIYMADIYYIVVIEHSVWFEFVVAENQFGNMSILTHVLLNKFKNAYVDGEVKRIPLQFILSNLSNFRSIDIINYDAIADMSQRRNNISEAMEYCLGLVKQEYGTINQSLFYQTVELNYPQLKAYATEGQQLQTI